MVIRLLDKLQERCRAILWCNKMVRVTRRKNSTIYICQYRVILFWLEFGTKSYAEQSGYNGETGLFGNNIYRLKVPDKYGGEVVCV